MDSLIYVTILSLTTNGSEVRRVRFAKTLDKAESDFRELLNLTKTEQDFIGRPYTLSTYKASEIIHSEVEA